MSQEESPLNPFQKCLFAPIMGCFMMAAFCDQAKALTLGQVGQMVETAEEATFQTIEFKSENAESRTPNWQKVKGVLGHEMAVLQACIENESACDKGAMRSWRAMVITAQSQPLDTQLQLVNVFFNSFQYRTDSEAYGQRDYWASPLAFLESAGDCEDYAIAKYATLRLLGVADNAMRIMAVVDQNRGGIGHSVLSVATQDGDLILDNLTNAVYADHQQTGYEPRFAVNMAGIYTYAQQPRIIYASLNR